jgi:uncharacterized protein
MSRKVFINLPVKDLSRSMDFFKRLGFGFNPQFTDEKAAAMELSGEGFVMLITEEYFQTFTKKPISDATSDTEVIIAVSADSKEEVDELVNKALAAGGSPSNDPTDYEGFMYTWGFQDVDGHLWEVLYTEPSAIQG